MSADAHAAIEPSPRRSRRAYLELFAISFIILFFELTCIRWFGSTVIFLTFFTNLVLMACFLGMSVGCLAASRRRDFIHAVIPLTLVAVGLACWALRIYHRYESEVMVDVGAQDSPDLIYFGTETRQREFTRYQVPIEAVAGVFFTLIALMFVGLGQVMGRCFNAIPNRVAAYSSNIFGSLVGIAAFGLVSYNRLPPLVWFLVSTVLCLYFIPTWRWKLVHALGVSALVPLLVIHHNPMSINERVEWSPYYKVQYDPNQPWIMVNNIMHQGMLSLQDFGPAYGLVHWINRDMGNPPFQDVLIIGAGSGNDVQAALMHGARHVDAVEIDPVLYEIGRDHHPNRPYDDPRVTIHLDDGRSFLHKTDKQYDLIVYALVDSLVLHSGYSSLRLESFLFTQQAFEDVQDKLKPGGLFVMYNYFRQGWMLGRLVKLTEQTFGTEPIVLSAPYNEEVKREDNLRDYMNFVLVGKPGPELTWMDQLHRQFREHQFFWSHNRPARNELFNAFGPRPPDATRIIDPNWFKVGPVRVETEGVEPLPTDDWPFLYLREPIIPGHNIRGMLIVGGLALAILLGFAPVRRIRPNGQMFFLGAGFMLLETKGVVHLALLFGSTWMVNSIVFFAILVMILLANLYVLTVKPKRLWPYYLLLLASLLINVFVPMTQYLALPGLTRVVVSCVVVFVPIFFAGVVFAASFAESRQPDVDFGSNIGGAMLGGLTEFFSNILGFTYLLVVGIGFYALAAAFKPRLRAEVAPTKPSPLEEM